MNRCFVLSSLLEQFRSISFSSGVISLLQGVYNRALVIGKASCVLDFLEINVIIYLFVFFFSSHRSSRIYLSHNNHSRYDIHSLQLQ